MTHMPVKCVSPLLDFPPSFATSFIGHRRPFNYAPFYITPNGGEITFNAYTEYLT